jgi:hypothetical protein
MHRHCLTADRDTAAAVDLDGQSMVFGHGALEDHKSTAGRAHQGDRQQQQRGLDDPEARGVVGNGKSEAAPLKSFEEPTAVARRDPALRLGAPDGQRFPAVRTFRCAAACALDLRFGGRVTPTIRVVVADRPPVSDWLNALHLCDICHVLTIFDQGHSAGRFLRVNVALWQQALPSDPSTLGEKP